MRWVWRLAPAALFYLRNELEPAPGTVTAGSILSAEEMAAIAGVYATSGP